jgi:hypothetical protein
MTEPKLPPLPGQHETCAVPDVILHPKLANTSHANITITLFPFADPGKPRPVMFDPVTQLMEEKRGSQMSMESSDTRDCGEIPVARLTLGRRVEPKDGEGRRQDKPGNVVLEQGFVGFKSKVVSRTHAEIWVRDGQVQFPLSDLPCLSKHQHTIRELAD